MTRTQALELATSQIVKALCAVYEAQAIVGRDSPHMHALVEIAEMLKNTGTAIAATEEANS